MRKYKFLFNIMSSKNVLCELGREFAEKESDRVRIRLN